MSILQSVPGGLVSTASGSAQEQTGHLPSDAGVTQSTPHFSRSFWNGKSADTPTRPPRLDEFCRMAGQRPRAALPGLDLIRVAPGLRSVAPHSREDMGLGNPAGISTAFGYIRLWSRQVIG